MLDVFYCIAEFHNAEFLGTRYIALILLGLANTWQTSKKILKKIWIFFDDKFSLVVHRFGIVPELNSWVGINLPGILSFRETVRGFVRISDANVIKLHFLRH